jgi:hypothetical protein
LETLTYEKFAVAEVVDGANWIFSTFTEIFVCGGVESGSQASSRAFSFDFYSEKRELLPPMMYCRAYHGVAKANGILYTIGGLTHTAQTKNGDQAWNEVYSS